MGKVVKAVAGVGLAIAGVVTGNPNLIIAGVGLSVSALTKKKAPQASPADRDRLLSTINPRTPRTMVFGSTALANDIRDQEFSGTNQEFLHRFVVVASHKVNAISKIWFDDKLAWTSAGGVESAFSGYLTVTAVLEGNAANAINISPRMGATRRYTGLAYVYFKFKLTGNSKKSESPFSSSVPSRVTIVGDAISVYDPRQDSTIAGGSGPHRADNQDTWTFGDHARNPALQALTFMLGWRINGKLVVGKGIPPRRIDIASFINAANVCDEPVALTSGGSEPRYRTGGVFSEGDDMSLVLGQFSASMDARFYDPQGRIAIKCMVNDLFNPIASFNENDIIDDVEWTPFGDLSENYNIVRGTYTDPSPNSLYQSVDYPEQYEASVDGIDRILTLDLPLVQSASQAQRLARRERLRAKYGQGVLTCTMQATAWRAEQFAPVSLSCAPLGMANKIFRVSEIEVRVDGTVPIVLQAEDPRIYEYAADIQPVQAIASTPYDPKNSPIAQGISQAFVEVTQSPNQIVIADYAGAVLAGQFPRVLKPTVLSAGVDVRTLDSTTYSISTAGVSATINNTDDSADKGWITVTDGGSGYIDLSVVVDGIAHGPFRTVFSKSNGALSTGGGIGSSGTRTTFSTITDDVAFVNLFNPPIPITITVGGGQTVFMTAPLEYNITGGSDATASLVAKWQRTPTGTANWVDIAPTVTGSASLWIEYGFSGAPGSGEFNASDSPGAGTYDYRMVARLDIGQVSSVLNIFNGVATVIAS